MASTVENIKDRIREILLIGGDIQKASTATARQANTADAPFAIIETGAAQYAYLSNDVRERIRDFSITIFHIPVNSGTEHEAEDACDVYFELIPDLFDRRPSLTRYDDVDEKDELPLANVQRAYLVADGGYATIRFGNTAWACAAGFVLRVELLYDREQNL